MLESHGNYVVTDRLVSSLATANSKSWVYCPQVPSPSLSPQSSNLSPLKHSHVSSNVLVCNWSTVNLMLLTYWRMVTGKWTWEWTCQWNFHDRVHYSQDWVQDQVFSVQVQVCMKMDLNLDSCPSLDSTTTRLVTRVFISGTCCIAVCHVISLWHLNLTANIWILENFGITVQCLC